MASRCSTPPSKGSACASRRDALLIVRHRLGAGPAGREFLRKGGAGARESAVNRRNRRVEHAGGLRSRPTQHIAEQKHSPRPGWQVLNRGDEGELHRLSNLVARVRSRRGVGNAIERRVRIGFESGDFDGRSLRRDLVGWRAVRLGQHPADAGATCLQPSGSATGERQEFRGVGEFWFACTIVISF